MVKRKDPSLENVGTINAKGATLTVGAKVEGNVLLCTAGGYYTKVAYAPGQTKSVRALLPFALGSLRQIIEHPAQVES